MAEGKWGERKRKWIKKGMGLEMKESGSGSDTEGERNLKKRAGSEGVACQ